MDKTKVVGILDAAPESLTVHIQSPFKHLKAGLRFSGCPIGDRRFPRNGKITTETIRCAEEMLKGLYLAGIHLKKDPAFIKRLRKYMTRFQEKVMLIQEERKKLLIKLDKSEITAKEYGSRLEELRLAENQNVIARGVIFRQFADKLKRRSGGLADIQSVFEFASCIPNQRKQGTK